MDIDHTDIVRGFGRWIVNKCDFLFQFSSQIVQFFFGKSDSIICDSNIQIIFWSGSLYDDDAAFLNLI